MSLVTTDWLFENLHNVKIIDSSWHLPNQNRNAHREYSNEHINNSIFFDIDKNSDQKTNLPHMLPKAKDLSAADRKKIKDRAYRMLYGTTNPKKIAEVKRKR